MSDALNRLTHVTETSRGYPTVERGYIYDSLGNMIQEEADECLEYHYHGTTLYESRECCEKAEYNGTKRWDYTYDGRGNLVSVDKYQRTTQGMQMVNSEKYVYDETGKLVRGTNEEGEVSLYTYNGLGVRVGRELIVKDNTHGYTDFHKETPSVETGIDKPEVVKESYVVDYTRATLDTLVKEEVGGNTDRWLYGLQSLQVKVTSEGTDWWGQQTEQDVLTAYTHHDRLGSIVNLTDQYGRNLVRADYREYGEIAFFDSITVNGGYRRIAPQLVYTNHEWDDVLDLYYAKARFYDPDEKRFLSTDPVKGNVANPLSLVPYLYCVDNPLRWVDPLGLATLTLNGSSIQLFTVSEPNFSKTSSATGNQYISITDFVNVVNFCANSNSKQSQLITYDVNNREFSYGPHVVSIDSTSIKSKDNEYFIRFECLQQVVSKLKIGTLKDKFSKIFDQDNSSKGRQDAKAAMRNLIKNQFMNGLRVPNYPNTYVAGVIGADKTIFFRNYYAVNVTRQPVMDAMNRYLDVSGQVATISDETSMFLDAVWQVAGDTLAAAGKNTHDLQNVPLLGFAVLIYNQVAESIHNADLERAYRNLVTETAKAVAVNEYDFEFFLLQGNPNEFLDIGYNPPRPYDAMPLIRSEFVKRLENKKAWIKRTAGGTLSAFGTSYLKGYLDAIDRAINYNSDGGSAFYNTFNTLQNNWDITNMTGEKWEKFWNKVQQYAK